MAETKLYVSLRRLSAYDEKIKKVITDGDAAALASAKTYADNAVAAEKERAEGIESGLNTRLAAVEADYLKAADKTELQGNITTNADAIAAIKEDVDAFFADADMTESAKDTLKELQEYISSDETGAAAMAASIKQNSDDIDALEGKVTTIEGNITALQGEDTAIKGRLDTLESAIGESGSVADDIAAAKQEAIEAAAADATTKANTAEGNAKTYADGLNTSMNTRVEALEAVDHSHANQTVLDGITAAKVTAWDAAEGNAKTYADGLNTAMDTRVTAVETGLAALVEASEEDINGLFA